jgi:CRP-like cAMP-binding protein
MLIPSIENATQRAARSVTRRQAVAAPPAPADPTPWQAAFGGSPLTPSDFQVLMSLARRRTVHAGETVLDRQRLASHLVLLLSGDVVLGTRDDAGVLHAERSVAAPAWLDVSAAWLGQPYAVDGNALNEVVIAELPILELRQHLARHAELADRFMVALATRVHELTLASRSLMRQDAPARLAGWLLQRCNAAPAIDEAGLEGHAAPLVLKLQERKRDVASQLAMTPETLSRLLRNFEERGVISVRGYTLVVQDLEALQQLAGH